ncbi:MAG: YraN family protein [Bacteroidota bacterium]
MHPSHQLGKKGEDIAVIWLKQHGYKILERRWRWRHMEIDIIATKNNMLVIVEVKSRSSAQHADPDDTLSRRQQRHLFDITDYYMEVKKSYLEVRYDLIVVVDHGETHSIEHIEDAFYPFMN